MDMNLDKVYMISLVNRERIRIVPGTLKTFMSNVGIVNVKMFSAWDLDENKEVVGLTTDVILTWFTEPRKPE